MKPKPASPLIMIEPIIARGMLTFALVVSSDMWTTPSTPSLPDQLLTLSRIASVGSRTSESECGCQKADAETDTIVGPTAVVDECTPYGGGRSLCTCREHRDHDNEEENAAVDISRDAFRVGHAYLLTRALSPRRSPIAAAISCRECCLRNL